MDGVGVIVVCYQYILGALAGCNWEPSCLVRVVFPVKPTVLRKTRLVSPDCVVGVNWSCYEYGSAWSTFSCVDLMPFLGCWRCPSMVDFLVKYFCTRSDDRPGQEVKIFLWLIFSIQIEWGSRIMRGDNPQVCPLTCTHTNPPQNIRQELSTLSLFYFAGSNWACTGLSEDILYLLLSLSHSLCWELVQTCKYMWLVIHDNTMFQWTTRPCCDLERYVLSVIESVGLVYIVGPCVWTWLFPHLACKWGADLQPVVYFLMASWGSDNALSSLCLTLLVHSLFLQV